MNTILSKILIILIILIHNIPESLSKEFENDSTFKLILEISGGYSGTLDSNLFDGGLTPNVRIMWEPDRKLNIGIESGYILIEEYSCEEKKYELGKTSLDVSLKAIPILVVFNMELWKTDLYAAMGASYVWTKLDAFNEKVYSPVWNYSLMFGCGYTYMFSRNIGLGIEAKTYIFTRLNKEVGSLQMKLKWNLIEW